MEVVRQGISVLNGFNNFFISTSPAPQVKGMTEERIKVITYSGYRGEEIPRFLILHGGEIEVIEITERWIEEGIEDRERKRFFIVKGSDGKKHKIYYDEKTMEWFYGAES